MNTKVDQRLNAIKTYFQYRSLRKAAQILKIPYQTIHRWVRWYRESGESGLMGGRYRRPWNRIDKETEERLVLLKEKNPGLTIQAARRYLKKEGFSISTNGIFKVWQRYGYTGFKRGEITSDFTESIPWTKEARQKYILAEELFKRGEVKKAAEIVNSIPSLPKNELLQMI
ncbi:MAG: helix-turn-helix domain-containing protein, partial [candidate division WOR-3 bacterium]